MSLPDMSFNFGPYNSLKDMGIICEAYDTLLPPKRSRKIEILGRSGLYDFGSDTYDERTITLSCKLINQITKAELREVAYKQITKAELREVAYKLSGKNKLSLWDEPEKYYIAELFDPSEVQSIADRLWLEFDLTFVCEPFAYTEVKTINVQEGANPIQYQGTIHTPTRITLVNNNDFPITNLTITAIRKR